MNETKDDLKREKVRIVPISNIEDFPDHPFQVKDDESMAQLVESIRMNGVLNPVIALNRVKNTQKQKSRRLYRRSGGGSRHRSCFSLNYQHLVYGHSQAGYDVYV